jgi:hypothetical protein
MIDPELTEMDGDCVIATVGQSLVVARMMEKGKGKRKLATTWREKS